MLIEILEKAQKLNFLGNAPITDHVKNANGFLEAIHTFSKDNEHGNIIDIGSGGGVPALILIEKLENWTFVLLERKKKRAEFLTQAIQALDVSARVEVVCDEVENVARSMDYMYSADFVTARAFGPPAVTAECACRLLKRNQFLVVSEPPNNENRWVDGNLSSTGLSAIKYLKFGISSFQVLQLINQPSDKLPRRPGIPRKRPLW